MLFLIYTSRCFTKESPEVWEGKLSWPTCQSSFLTLLAISSLAQPGGSRQDFQFPNQESTKATLQQGPEPSPEGLTWCPGPTDPAACGNRSVNGGTKSAAPRLWEPGRPRGPVTPRAGTGRSVVGSRAVPKHAGLLLYPGTGWGSTSPLLKL